MSDPVDLPPWSTCRNLTHSPTKPTYVSIFSLLSGCMATRRYIRLDKGLYKRYSCHGARVWDRSGSKSYKAGTVFYIFLSFIWISQLCILLSWSDEVNREVKFDVTWSYVKPQTAKMKLLPSVFSSLNSRVKIFVFVANSRRHFSIFMWFNEGLKEKNTNSEVIFAVCRLTLDHVTSNLISLIPRNYLNSNSKLH